MWIVKEAEWWLVPIISVIMWDENCICRKIKRKTFFFLSFFLLRINRELRANVIDDASLMIIWFIGIFFFFIIVAHSSRCLYFRWAGLGKELRTLLSRLQNLFTMKQKKIAIIIFLWCTSYVHIKTAAIAMSDTQFFFCRWKSQTDIVNYRQFWGTTSRDRWIFHEKYERSFSSSRLVFECFDFLFHWFLIDFFPISLCR